MIYWFVNAFMTEALLYRNQSIDLFRKSIDWFLYDNGFRQERFHSNFNLMLSA